MLLSLLVALAIAGSDPGLPTEASPVGDLPRAATADELQAHADRVGEWKGIAGTSCVSSHGLMVIHARGKKVGKPFFGKGEWTWMYRPVEGGTYQLTAVVFEDRGAVDPEHPEWLGLVSNSSIYHQPGSVYATASQSGEPEFMFGPKAIGTRNTRRIVELGPGMWQALGLMDIPAAVDLALAESDNDVDAARQKLRDWGMWGKMRDDGAGLSKPQFAQLLAALAAASE